MFPLLVFFCGPNLFRRRRRFFLLKSLSAGAKRGAGFLTYNNIDSVELSIHWFIALVRCTAWVRLLCRPAQLFLKRSLIKQSMLKFAVGSWAESLYRSDSFRAPSIESQGFYQRGLHKKSVSEGPAKLVKSLHSTKTLALLGRLSSRRR